LPSMRNPGNRKKANQTGENVRTARMGGRAGRPKTSGKPRIPKRLAKPR